MSVTNIREEKDGTYSVFIDGDPWSGIGPGSKFFGSVKSAIGKGEHVEPYVGPAGTPVNEVVEIGRAIILFAKLSLDDILEEHANNSKDIKKAVKDLLRARKDLLDALA